MGMLCFFACGYIKYTSALIRSDFWVFYWFYFSFYDYTGKKCMDCCCACTISTNWIIVFANMILIQLLNIDDTTQRVLVFLLFSFSYSNFEGILIVEKYIFSYFWLVMYIAWEVSERKEDDSFVTSMLIGSMVTSVFLVLFIVFEKCKFSVIFLL